VTIAIDELDARATGMDATRIGPVDRHV